MQHIIHFSGYLQQLVLFSLEDLEELLLKLKPFGFFNVSSVQTHSSKQVNLESFLSFYEKYLLGLFNETDVDLQELSFYFSHSLATDESCFVKAVFSNERYLLKPKRSVIQLQPLGLFVSSLDKNVHTKTFAKDAQSFGLKISFPTIYEDTTLHQVFELKPDDEQYAKFNIIRQFIRHKTKPLILRLGENKNVLAVRYSEDLKDQISKMSFFEKHGLKVSV